MIRVISANLNGIRAATRKGWPQWLASQQADIVCVQELKAQIADIEPDLHCIDGMNASFGVAEKKGYSGVGLYSRRKPLAVKIGFGNREFDAEGRYIEADFGKYIVISVYVPSGTSSPERLEAKYRFMDAFLRHLRKLMRGDKEVILCGDWNIAHKEIDLRNWRTNQKNSGFLPEERAWMTKVFDSVGYVDVFRQLNDSADEYTFWSNRGQSWAKNVGWRLDYQVATPGIASKAKATSIFRDERFSDHAPLIVDYAVRA